MSTPIILKFIPNNVAFLFFSFLLATIFPCNAIPEKKIVVVITSYNNQNWYQKNLDSVFAQRYQNYRIIYIDDCSPDGTGKLVQEYIKEIGQEFRTTLVLNQEWQSQMANHYKAVYMCDDDEIVCQLDGDDWLFDENVLSIINQAYSHEEIWLTVGVSLLSTGERYYFIPTNMGEIIQKNSYRNEGWHFNHLRTFYAWLFKLIKLEDVLLQSSFAKVAPAPDVAMMYPMFEMAARHGRVLYDSLYVENVKNPIRQQYLKPRDEIEEVAFAFRFGHPPYKPLDCPVIHRMDQFENKKADLVILVEGGQTLAITTLQAITQYLSNLNKVYIIGENLSPELENLKVDFPECTLIVYDPKETYFESVLHHILEVSSDYIIFSSHDYVVERPRDISLCIKELEKTFAYAFYLHLKYHTDLKPVFAPLFEDLIAWQPNYTKHIWECPNTLGMILYRKHDIAAKIKGMNCKNIYQFKRLWAYHEMERYAVGLLYRD